jgi:hypothetical protein
MDEKLNSTPFVKNKRYGLYNDKREIVKDRYFEILGVKNEEINEAHGMRTLILEIRYKRGPGLEPVVIEDVDLTKHDESDDYILSFMDEHHRYGFRIPNLVVSLKPPEQGGGHRNRKSTKRVRRRRRNKPTGRRSIY